MRFRLFLTAGLLCCSSLFVCTAQERVTVQPSASIDSDEDGLSDALEQALLTQFEPEFRVGKKDCLTW
jgi:hypothetical protein